MSHWWVIVHKTGDIYVHRRRLPLTEVYPSMHGDCANAENRSSARNSFPPSPTNHKLSERSRLMLIYSRPTYEPFDAAISKDRTPRPSKGKQWLGALSSGKRPLESMNAGKASRFETALAKSRFSRIGNCRMGADDKAA